MGKQSNKGPSVHVVMDSQGNRLETFTLHSVRRQPASNGKRHANVVPNKVYIVEPRGFLHLVQKLTGAPKVATANTAVNGPSLQDRLPPPPEAVAPLPERCEDNTLPLLPNYMASEGLQLLPENFGSSFGFPVPSAHSPWSTFPLLSPGTMASLEQGASI